MEKIIYDNENNGPKLPEESCINCHFLSKYFLIFNKKKEMENFEYIVPLTPYDREKAKIKIFDWQMENFEGKEYKLRCYFRVWDEAVNNFDIDEKFKNIMEIDRKDKCDFWKYDIKAGFHNVEEREHCQCKEYKRNWYRVIFNVMIVVAMVVLIADIIYMSR